MSDSNPERRMSDVSPERRMSDVNPERRMSDPDGDAPSPIPMSVGRPSLAWFATCAVLVCIVALGAFGYAQQRLHGDVVTGLRTLAEGGAAWGVYICCDVIFVGFAFACLTLTAVTRLFRIRTLWPLSRIAEVLAVASLSLAGLCVIADLGRPLHGLIYLPKFARTGSPFFGTFTLIMGAGLSAAALYLLLDGRADAAWCARHATRTRPVYRLLALGYQDSSAERRRHRQVSFWLSMVLLPLMLVAYSTLGLVFGIQGGRPGWYGALQAPSFVVLAAASGLGVVLVVAALARRTLDLARELPDVAFRWLGNALGILVLVYMYLLGVEELTARYTPSQAQARLSHALSQGDFARPFWFMIACFTVALVFLFVRGLTRRTNAFDAAFAGLLVNAGALLKRFLVVVPSQTHGSLLEWPSRGYMPSWVEWSVVAGALALGTLMVLVYAKVFPIVPLQAVGVEPIQLEAEHRADQRTGLRRFAVGFLLVSGLTLAGVGLALSARFGTLPYLDPLIPFSPVLFITGVVIALSSALVYELLPARRTA